MGAFGTDTHLFFSHGCLSLCLFFCTHGLAFVFFVFEIVSAAKGFTYNAAAAIVVCMRRRAGRSDWGAAYFYVVDSY